MKKRLLAMLLSLMLVSSAFAALAEEPAESAAPAQEVSVPETEETVAPETEATAAPEAQPELLVTVNGEEVYSDNADVQYWISYYLYQLSSSGYDVSDPSLLSTVNQYSLLNTIRFILIRQKAAEMGLDQFTDEDVAAMDAEAKAQWADILDSYMEDAGLTETSTEEERANAKAAAEAELLSEGYDEATYVAEYVDSARQNALINRLRDALATDVEVTDEDIQDHFEDLVEEDKEMYGSDIATYEFYTQYYGQNSYYVPDGYRGITHILLSVDENLMNTWQDLSARLEEQKSAAEATATDEDGEDEEEDEEETEEGTAPEAETTPEPASSEPTAEPTATPEPVTQEQVDAARQAILDSVKPTVDEIMAKLAAGSTFEELILEYGKDPGMQDANTRAKGYSVHADSFIWDPAFIAGAMTLEKIGDVSEPVLGQNGVHILYYLRDVPGGAVELTEEMKEAFRQELLEEEKNNALNTALDTWMQEGSLVYTEAGEPWRLPLTSTEADEDEDEDEDEADEEEGETEVTAAPEATGEDAAPETETTPEPETTEAPAGE